jgi:hypothetical protein
MSIGVIARRAPLGGAGGWNATTICERSRDCLPALPPLPPLRTAASRPARMFEQAFKNIDDVLRKEAGCTTELDYTEQTYWLLFLKYLDALEQDRATEAKLEGRRYSYLLPAEFRCWPVGVATPAA